ncbi:hypothetical protein V6N13_135849 [Hibiscus sabdariffa]
MEAWQIEFIKESKVFRTTLLQFLHDHFPTTAEFSQAHSSTTPAVVNSAATLSAEVAETEEVHYSSNVEPDAFDWNTPYEYPPSPPKQPVDIAESSIAQKRKAPVARIIKEDRSPELTPDPTAVADLPAQTSPAKRQKYLHIITSDSDDDGSNDKPSSKSLAF